MRIALRVELDDGTIKETSASTADLVAFEDAFDRSVIGIGDDLRLHHLCWLAWKSLCRNGREDRAFDDWLAQVESVIVTDGETEPVPLDRTASTSD